MTKPNLASEIDLAHAAKHVRHISQIPAFPHNEGYMEYRRFIQGLIVAAMGIPPKLLRNPFPNEVLRLTYCETDKGDSHGT